MADDAEHPRSRRLLRRLPVNLHAIPLPGVSCLQVVPPAWLAAGQGGSAHLPDRYSNEGPRTTDWL
ncbi:hypothetical protein, partial [Pseudomonas aeruginosa]|uniref:hypothetical protein n=1 Tax=Pseudomonas aeruginosa TaxID=287 RepID=UPI003C7C9D1E